MREMQWIAVICVAAACGGSADQPNDAGNGDTVDAPGPDAGAPGPGIDAAAPGPEIDASCAAPAAPVVDCGSGGCAPISVTSDPPATASGSFTGLADPAIAHDPDAAGTVWLAYSWPHVGAGKNTSNQTVEMGVVESHLARSTDHGGMFTRAGSGALWPAVAAADPEGSGETGFIASETPSITSITTAGTTTWYGSHLRYFLRPVSGYSPKYTTSWTVRVTAAASPAALATSPETVLGVSTTAAVYAPAVALDELAGLPITRCAILNNPTLFAQGGSLYLIVECLAFDGAAANLASSSTQVFATTPTGAPATWTWRHVGVLADHTLAAELGADELTQPDVSLAADGTPIAILSTFHANGSGGTTSDGCSVVALRSIDPPVVARDCAGHAIVRARISGAGYGSCAHDAAATATGVITTSTAAGANWQLHASGGAP